MSAMSDRGAPDSEFSESFVDGMRDRMAVSFHKYGAVARAYPANVDAMACLKQRLERYEADGNADWLMDVANFAMIEAMHPRHPKAHLRGTDSDESPGRVTTQGQTAASNDLIAVAKKRGVTFGWRDE